jgi:beta-glucanase (GH16 family)
MAPPPADALAHYVETYVTDFTGSTLPPTWLVFTGKPGGDPGAQWSANHVVVSGGLLRLNTWQDPAYGNNWVTGGVCQCGFKQTYGAYFVRSRMTSEGPNDVELLWPAANVWPPEIDFYETGKPTSASATVHFSPTNQIDQVQLLVNTLQWHTWGVIWTPSSITYTVDGQVWGTVNTAAAIPNQAMTLDIDQESWCGRGWDCPTGPDSMLVDWAAEYAPVK